MDAALEERHGERRHAKVPPRVDVLGAIQYLLNFGNKTRCKTGMRSGATSVLGYYKFQNSEHDLRKVLGQILGGK